jgi:hypothetical protein
MITSNQHLASLRERTRQYLREVPLLTEGLDEKQLAWTAEPGRWSMAQCFDHLAVTAASYHPRIAAAIERHRSPSAGSDPYRGTWIGRKFVDAMRDPTGQRRFWAPRPFRPLPQPPPGSEQRLTASIQELDELLERASGADIVHAKIASPVIPLLHLNLGEALELQVVHIARHLAQARRVREHHEFPSAAVGR